jgi:hypothetical protein
VVVVRDECGRRGQPDADGQRPARCLARPVVLRAEPRVRAALPLALCDVRPVIRPTISSTQAPILSKRPSAWLRRELLNITSSSLKLPAKRITPRVGAQTSFPPSETSASAGGITRGIKGSRAFWDVLATGKSQLCVSDHSRGRPRAARVKSYAVKTRSVRGMERCEGDGEDRHATSGEEDGAIGEAGCSLGGGGDRVALTRQRGVDRARGVSRDRQLESAD